MSAGGVSITRECLEVATAANASRSLLQRTPGCQYILSLHTGMISCHCCLFKLSIHTNEYQALIHGILPLSLPHQDGRIILWGVNIKHAAAGAVVTSVHEMRRCSGHTATVRAMHGHPKLPLAASVGEDGALIVWELGTAHNHCIVLW